MLLGVIGFLTFGSVFVSGAMHFGDFSNFQEQSRSEMTRGIVGMAFMIGVLLRIILINAVLLPVTAIGLWLRHRSRRILKDPRVA